MFAKMFGTSKGESNTEREHQITREKVSKMNLTEMRQYVNNKIDNLEVSEIGLLEIMKILNSQESNTSKNFLDDAMDSKKKKAFDLIILIAASKKISIEVAESIQEFIKIYNSMIANFDKQNKEIYADKLHSALKKSLTNLDSLAEFNKKMKVIGS